MQISEIATVHSLRKNVYIFFDYIFRKDIDDETFKKLNDILPKLEVYVNSFADENIRTSLKVLSETLQNDRNIYNLQTEYARLFYSVEKGRGVNPYESVHLSPERLVMQEPRDEVVEFYADYKAKVSKDMFKEPEDHLSAELSFMAYMHSKIIDEIAEDNTEKVLETLKASSDFLTKHLLKWVDLFVEELMLANSNDFYLYSGIILSALLHEDKKYLDDFVKALSE